MRWIMSLVLILWGLVWLVWIIHLLDCECAQVSWTHFVGVAVNFIGGFALLTKEE